MTTTPDPDATLVHLCARDDWSLVAADGGDYRPPSLTEVGFIHLSTPGQVHLPANRLFAGRTDIVVMYLDATKLAAEVRWEPGVPDDPSDMLFPHVYGPIPLGAVTGVDPYLPGFDGRFGPLEPGTGQSR